MIDCFLGRNCCFLILGLWDFRKVILLAGNLVNISDIEDILPQISDLLLELSDNLLHFGDQALIIQLLASFLRGLYPHEFI